MIDLVCYIVKKYKYNILKISHQFLFKYYSIYYFEKTPLKFELRVLKQLCDVDQFYVW